MTKWRVGDQVEVTHRDGTVREGIIKEILAETPRGPECVFYVIDMHSQSYMAQPAYGDKVVLVSEIEVEMLPGSVVRCLDPDEGLKKTQPLDDKVVLTQPEVANCRWCKDPMALNYKMPGWCCTVYEVYPCPCTSDPSQEKALYWCEEHGEGWCGRIK